MQGLFSRGSGGSGPDIGRGALIHPRRNHRGRTGPAIGPARYRVGGRGHRASRSPCAGCVRHGVMDARVRL
jgi:hypothetical protein